MDHKLQIRNVYTGWPGCIHDARVLRNSHLYTEGEEGVILPPDKLIIADSAYPLRRWLITPFKDNGQMTAVQRIYLLWWGGVGDIIYTSPRFIWRLDGFNSLIFTI